MSVIDSVKEKVQLALTLRSMCTGLAISNAKWGQKMTQKKSVMQQVGVRTEGRLLHLKALTLQILNIKCKSIFGTDARSVRSICERTGFQKDRVS